MGFFSGFALYSLLLFFFVKCIKNKNEFNSDSTESLSKKQIEKEQKLETPVEFEFLIKQTNELLNLSIWLKWQTISVNRVRYRYIYDFISEYIMKM